MSKPKRKNHLMESPTMVSNSSEVAKDSYIFPIVLSLFGIGLYLNTLKHGFVLDDGLVTTVNAYVKKGFGGLWDIFTHSYRAGASISTDSDYMYRPLSVMMFAKEWSFYPNQAWIHHLFNILFYGISLFVLFITLKKLFGTNNRLVLIGACLIFASHPIHTEVVANIKSRDEIMSFLFGMLSLWGLLKAHEGSKRGWWLSGVSFFLALLSKEGAVTFLLIIPLSLYFFTNYKPFLKSWLLLVVFALWYVLRYSIMGALNYVPDPNDNQLVQLDLLHRWASAFPVLLHYIKLLTWPHPLSWDYSFRQFENVGWENITSIVSLFFHLFLLGFAIWKFKEKKFIAFCILAYLISMFLYSNMVILIGTLMGERLAYQSSIWYCLFLAYGVHWISKKYLSATLSNTFFYSVIGLLVTTYSIMTFQRSKVWASSYTLFLNDIRHAPNSFRTHQAIADESLQLFLKKYQNPQDSVLYISQAQNEYIASGNVRKTFGNQVGLGNTYLFQKNYQKAIDAFLSAKEIKNNTVIRERLTTTYYQFGRAEAQVNNNLIKAKELLLKAHELDSTRSDILTDLGMAIGLNRQVEEAIPFFEKAFNLKPEDETIINNLVHSYILVGLQSKADSLLSLSKKK